MFSTRTKFIILLVVVGVLAFVVYLQRQIPGISEVDKNLTTKQRELLYFPSKEASAEEKKQHFNLVVSQAVTSEYLDINGCVAKPIVKKIKLGDTLKVKNSNSFDISFSLSGVKVPISAGQTVSIMPDFKNGPGLYGFSCSDPNVNHPIGIIYVMP